MILFSILALAVSSCDGQKVKGAEADSPRNGLYMTKGVLPLPSVPDDITGTRERATYLVEHFWDVMDFRDTICSHNSLFMEQNFSNYISLFPMVDREKLLRAVTHTLLTAENADAGAFKLMASVAEKYLYESDSPMKDEEMYELFLPAMISSSIFDKATKQRYIYQQECINKNRCGSIAADFSYCDLRGRLHTLWTTDAADRLLLLFFDPGCDQCRETLADLEASRELKGLVSSGNLSVMAICAVDDKAHWSEVKSELPADWIVGLDNSGIDDNRIYVLRGLPSIYLLDSEKRVVLKDVHVDTAMDYILDGNIPQRRV